MDIKYFEDKLSRAEKQLKLVKEVDEIFNNMKKYERVTIWVGDKCSFSTSTPLDMKTFGQEDLVILLKEIIELLEAPEVEDKEIF